MAAARTAWHVLLATLLHERAPKRFEVRSEVPLSTEPLRADYLLLRAAGDATDDGTSPKRWRLWSLLPRDTLVELKSTGRPYRSRNLDRLLAYLCLYYADQHARLERRAELSGVLLVAARNPALDRDVEGLGWAWQDEGDGYWKLTGGPFALHVVEIDEVAEAEDDDLLRLFGHAELHTTEARRWLYEQVGTKESTMAMHEMEGYQEIVRKFLANVPPEERLAGLSPEQRIAGLAPEQRVAGLAPEQRIAGLTREQVLLALSDEMLGALSDEYLSTFSATTRAAVRTRIGR